MKLLITQFFQPPVTSSLYGPNILLSTLFSNTLSLCSSLNGRDQVSQPYRTKGKTDVRIPILNYGFVTFQSLPTFRQATGQYRFQEHSPFPLHRSPSTYMPRWYPQTPPVRFTIRVPYSLFLFPHARGRIPPETSHRLTPETVSQNVVLCSLLPDPSTCMRL
jgi:hypothetical protein